MRRNTVRRALVATGMSVVALTASAVPASAALAPTPFDADVYVSKDMPGYSVLSYCQLSVGYTTDPRFINWVVVATAEASGPSVALATSVECTVYDSLDKSDTYGGASGALPGPYVIAVGQATVPVGRVPAVCVRAGATFLNGVTLASPKSCP